MSAVLEREVSAGYPVEGVKFEPPQNSKDNEQPRFVNILGSTIEPETAEQREWTKWGGIEVGSPCLRYVKNFLCKGKITPILKDTHDWCTVDWWEKATGKDASYFPRPIPPGYQAPMNEFGRPSNIPPMMGKMAFPGDQLESIINGNTNVFKMVRRGIVEHKSLRGMDYNPTRLENGVVADPEIWKIQTAIFPKFPFLPILLDEIEELLEAAKIHTILRPTVDEMFTSLNQFRDYARGTVEQTHYTMRETGMKSEAGYIPRYVSLEFVLLEQLGMARQDVAIRKGVKEAQNDSQLSEMFKQFIALQIEEKQANIERMKRIDGAPNGNTMAASPIQAGDAGQDGQPGHGGTSGASGASGQSFTNATPEQQEQMAIAMADTQELKFTCVCGNEAKSLAGLKAHERFCEKAKAQS